MKKVLICLRQVNCVWASGMVMRLSEQQVKNLCNACNIIGNNQPTVYLKQKFSSELHAQACLSGHGTFFIVSCEFWGPDFQLNSYFINDCCYIYLEHLQKSHVFSQKLTIQRGTQCDENHFRSLGIKATS